MTNSLRPQIPFTQSTQQSIALRIRRFRKSRGWTLAAAEKASGGTIKAVVLGSYERGDRSMSVERAIDIANLFKVPLAELLTEPQLHSQSTNEGDDDRQKIVIDLRRTTEANLPRSTISDQFCLFLAWITGLRQDWNGEVLSLRRADLDVLSLMMFKSPESVLEWMQRNRLLIPLSSTDSS